MKALAQSFFIGLLLLWATAYAQNQDSLTLQGDDKQTILTESDIAYWEWEDHNLYLKAEAVEKLKKEVVTGKKWAITLGTTKVLEGMFAESSCSSCPVGMPLLMLMEPSQRLSIHKHNVIFFYFFKTSVSQDPRLIDAASFKLSGPLLLSHLLSRDLIPADYRMRFLLGRIGMGLVAKQIPSPP